MSTEHVVTVFAVPASANGEAMGQLIGHHPKTDHSLCYLRK